MVFLKMTPHQFTCGHKTFEITKDCNVIAKHVSFAIYARFLSEHFSSYLREHVQM